MASDANTAPNPVRNIGKVQKFTVGTDFEAYTEQLGFFFVANGVTDAKQKKAILLTNLPTETYQLAKDLMAPTLLGEDSLTYNAIVERLREQLKPQKSALVARYEFDNRARNAGETVSQYVAVLKHLAMDCKFNDAMRLERLRDRLVSGIRDKRMMSELLKLKLEELTFDIAVAKCLAIEQSYKDVEALQGNKASESIDLLAKSKPGKKLKFKREAKLSEKRGSFSPKRAGDQSCYRCLGIHDHKSCPFKKEKCHHCNKTGHIVRACKSKKKETQVSQPPVNYVDSDDGDSDDYLASLEVNNVGDKDHVIWVNPEIQGKVVKMELDTGSAVSVLPYKQYKEHFNHVKLSKSLVTLKTYTGQKITPKGEMRCNVKFKGQEKELNLQVVETQGPALFGRDWLSNIQLNWGEIKTFKLSKTSEGGMARKVDQLLQKYESVFSENLGTLKGYKADLKVEEGCQSSFHKPRQVPYALRPKVEAELTRLEKEGILSKVEYSEWATPIVPVVKRNGSVRVCGDFKVSVNPVLLAEQYPLPRIEDIFANLAGGRHFSKLDLRQAYHQMEVTERSKELLTINTHKGLFRYNRLVFGISSSPAIWQRAIDQVLQGIPGTQCILDDMIVTGKTDEEHLENLESVLKRLQDAGLKANKEKCEFFKDRVQFCGHEIDKEGLHKTQEKIEAVVSAPRPENVSQLRSFLGLVNYYNRFLPNASTVLHPLHQLLEQNNEWQWTERCERAFTEAKRMITSEQVLTHYDPALPVRLACDASPTGIGAVLSHVMSDGSERPVAFASRSLTKTERRYAQIDKEALSIVWGVKRFHVYLYGRRFTLITDHKPLTAIFHPERGVPAMTAARLQRYALFLSGFDYIIEYKSTTKHCNADGLSRLPLQQKEREDLEVDSTEVFHASQFVPLPITSEAVARETRRDVVLARIHDSIVKGWSTRVEGDKPYYERRNELTVHQGCILWGMRVVVPNKLQSRVLEELHDGHLGMVKMKALARSYVWWPNINGHLEELAKGCSGCQQNQKMPAKTPLHPWEWATTPWQRIHIDYAGPFQNSMFLVVVDAHTKWPEVVPVKSTSSSSTIEILRDLFARFGIPEQIVSDNGTQFVSEEFQTFVKSNGIRHITSAPYHPATNGLAERTVQTFKQALRSMRQSPKPVREKLAKFLIAYRNTPHSTTGESPAQLLLGRPLRTLLDLVKPNLNRKMVNQQHQQSIKAAIDKGKQYRQLEMGDSVMSRDYRGDLKWRPGLIVNKTGPLMYEVQVAPGLIWRRHIDQLRPTAVGHTVESTDADCSVEVSQPEMANTPLTPITSSTPTTEGGTAPGGSKKDQPKMVPVSTPTVPDPPDAKPATVSPMVKMRQHPQRVRRAPQRLDL